jgi:peptidoglycan/LPS O-acetylase OafA/YrhL
MPAIEKRSPTPNLFSPSKGRGTGRFYPQLDGLRAVAVVLVLMHHMEDLSLPGALRYLSSLGWIGVDAFFVLSGFLITKILLGCEPGIRSFGLFVLRRTLRTWPLYFAVLLIAYLTIRHDPAGREINWLQHVFFLQNYTPAFIARCVAPTWSLCIEEHFYFLWPFMVFLVPRRALLWVLPVIFVVLPFGRFWGLHDAFTYEQLYTETQFHLDGLVAGSLVALLLSWYNVRSRPMIWVARSCLILGIGAAFLGFWRSWDAVTGHNVVFGFTSLAIAFAGLLLLLLHGESSILIKVFSLGPLRYIGRISYGIYILHGGLIALLGRLPLHRVLGAVAGSWMFVIPLRMGLAIGVAALSYRFFESPILRLKDRLR